jgi:formylglycine-generating enzyme required for sulfatase activity
MQPPARYLAHPVVLVDHAEASAYCRWRGVRLPLEEEWERAARGTDGRIFPWGDEYDPTRLDDRVFGPGDTTPVLTFHRGLSPEGVADMAGNVLQWTDSPGRQPGTFIVRGSAWDEPRGSGRVAVRREHDASRREATLGFRCATREAP